MKVGENLYRKTGTQRKVGINLTVSLSAILLIISLLTDFAFNPMKKKKTSLYLKHMDK